MDGVATPFTFTGNAEVWMAFGAVGDRPLEARAQRWPTAGLALESVSHQDVRDRG